MADPFVAEIRIFPFNFAPKGWAFCDGQLLPISQNTALFSLLGTFYGGDGKSTFALPNLQGSAALHQGQGPGLSQYFLGQQGGAQFVTLIQSEMPGHIHNVGMANAGNGDSLTPVGNTWASVPSGRGFLLTYHSGPPTAQVLATSILPAGASLPHNNMQPYLTLSFCIALQGVFPARP
jgi:microcystin-dependent protein